MIGKAVKRLGPAAAAAYDTFTTLFCTDLHIRKTAIQSFFKLYRGFVLADREGFEPSRPLWGLHDFQSCALDQLSHLSTYSVVQRLTA